MMNLNSPCLIGPKRISPRINQLAFQYHNQAIYVWALRKMPVTTETASEILAGSVFPGDTFLEI